MCVQIKNAADGEETNYPTSKLQATVNLHSSKLLDYGGVLHGVCSCAGLRKLCVLHIICLIYAGNSFRSASGNTV